MSWSIEQRISDPNRIVTELLRPFGQFQQWSSGRSALHHAFARREQISDFRRHPSLLAIRMRRVRCPGPPDMRRTSLRSVVGFLTIENAFEGAEVPFRRS